MFCLSLAFFFFFFIVVCNRILLAAFVTPTLKVFNFLFIVLRTRVKQRLEETTKAMSTPVLRLVASSRMTE
uniref:Putative secreted protein n=1 Tax=Ixodes scapularis TaxID=6945 RepID=A0A4D5RCU7_IXOSC